MEETLAKRISVSRSELGSLRRMLVRLQRLLFGTGCILSPS
jgi:hypothetical protein